MFYATDVCCYGRVYNDVSQLDPNDTLVQRGLRSCAKAQKLNIPKILYWVVYTVPYLDYQLTTRDLALQVKKPAASLHSEKIFLVDWVAYKAVMQYSVRSSSFVTVSYSMKNLITCFHFYSDVQH